MRLLTLSVAAGAVALLWAVPLSSGAGRPLVTAINDDQSYASPDAALAFDRTQKAGATLVRLNVRWDDVAPSGKKKPAGFDASNPADPLYDWADVDRKVGLAFAHGLQPILAFYAAPGWAQDQTPHPRTVEGLKVGPWKPSPDEVGAFAHALAVRFGGSFQGLPRVRYWGLWNEPNLSGYLSPQVESGKPFAPGWYRLMLQSFAAAVRGVHPDNLILAGTLAPFSHGEAATGPLLFMRTMFCLGKDLKPVCAERSPFDAFGIQPYTSGGPTHHAFNPDDVSVGDLPQVRRTLDAAAGAGRIGSRGRPRLWVTEFSWDTRPQDPNPLATPVDLQATWTAEALYRMWKSNIDVVTWFLLRDMAWPDSVYQSGLYFRSGSSMANDVAKPALTVFRFPFVTLRQKKGMYVWGRTPAGRRARVIVEQRQPRRWKRLATIRSDRYGIFQRLIRRKIVQPRPVRAVGSTSYRAAVLADSPASYWRLDDSGRTARDLMGRRMAIASGGVTFGVPGALLNDSNTAVTFNGTDGKIDLGPIASPHTVELWMKTASSDSTPIFSNRDLLGQYVYLATFLHNPHVFEGFNLFGGANLTNDRWHHVVYTYSGITGKVYVDGRLDGETTWLRREGGWEASLAYDAASRTHFKGSVDEVAVYDRALTAEQVRNHYLSSGRTLPAVPDLGSLRARLIGSSDASRPFPLRRPPDRYVLPFGG